MDNRVKAKRAGRDFEALMMRAMAGEAGPGAEGQGLAVLFQLATLYVTGGGELGQALRRFLDALADKADPLRRDIPPDLWAAIWPTLNTLNQARRQFDEQQSESAADGGARVLGNGAAEVGAEAVEGGGR